MSYCRWSSMNFKCDLYCYEDASGGWTTHVAYRRRIGDPGENPYDLIYTKDPIPEDWSERVRAYHERLNALPMEEITLQHAGETFNDASLEEFKQRLVYLKSLGYVFPDSVFDRIREEMDSA